MWVEQITKIRKNIDSLKNWIPEPQYQSIAEQVSGADSNKIAEGLCSIIDSVSEMNVAGECKEPSKDDIAHLHYHHEKADWFIIQKDRDEEQLQTIGVAILDGKAILGHIPVAEFIKPESGVKLNYNYTPQPVSEVLKRITPEKTHSLL